MSDSCILPNCHCSDVVVGLQSALAALQRRVADLEEKQAIAREDTMLRYPGLSNPSPLTWKALEQFIPRNELTRLMRRSGGWRKLVTSLVCAVFSKDVLIQSSVTGRNTHNAPLDPARRNAILDFVMEAFPYEGIEVSDFNQIILAKIKNLRHIEKTKGAVVYERMRPSDRPYSPNDIMPGTIIVPDN